MKDENDNYYSLYFLIISLTGNSGIIICDVFGSWLMAIVLMMCEFIVNGNKWEGFNTTWAYCAVFYTVLYVVYLLIITDIVSIVLNNN